MALADIKTPIKPLTTDEIHFVACEVDHDIKNLDGGIHRVRWNNDAMARMLATIGSLKGDENQSYGAYQPVAGVNLSSRDFYERFEDMSCDGKLQLFIEDDGDVIVSILPGSESRKPPVSVQFCSGSGGGQSPRVRLALLELARAIELSNRENEQHRRVK